MFERLKAAMGQQNTTLNGTHGSGSERKSASGTGTRQTSQQRNVSSPVNYAGSEKGYSGERSGDGDRGTKKKVAGGRGGRTFTSSSSSSSKSVTVGTRFRKAGSSLGRSKSSSSSLGLAGASARYKSKIGKKESDLEKDIVKAIDAIISGKSR